jgi:hypothetical protein
VIASPPLGIVEVTLAPRPRVEAAAVACRLGFAHIDVSVPSTVGPHGPDAEPTEPARLALPVGDRMAFPSPVPGCSVPAPPDSPGMWERAVRAYRRTPGLRVEPWPGSIIDSVAKARALVDEVEGLRLLVDTGHVAAWGEDPVELLDVAGHVQLRQARRGVVQAPADAGDVDFARVFARLAAVGYGGLVSVEYFDLPDRGWGLDDPLGHALDLARRLGGLSPPGE